MGLKEFIESVKRSFKVDMSEFKKMFLPDKNVRRQFWMILVAMFLAVYSRDLFEAIVNLMKKNYQPWYTELIAFLLGFSFLIFSFFVLYFMGLALIYIGEIFIVRGRKDYKEPVIDAVRNEEILEKKKEQKKRFSKQALIALSLFILLAVIEVVLLLLVGKVATYSVSIVPKVIILLLAVSIFILVAYELWAYTLFVLSKKPESEKSREYKILIKRDLKSLIIGSGILITAQSAFVPILSPNFSFDAQERTSNAIINNTPYTWDIYEITARPPLIPLINCETIPIANKRLYFEPKEYNRLLTAKKVEETRIKLCTYVDGWVLNSIKTKAKIGRENEIDMNTWAGKLEPWDTTYAKEKAIGLNSTFQYIYRFSLTNNENLTLRLIPWKVKIIDEYNLTDESWEILYERARNQGYQKCYRLDLKTDHLGGGGYTSTKVKLLTPNMLKNREDFSIDIWDNIPPNSYASFEIQIYEIGCV